MTEKKQSVLDTADTTAEFDPKDIEQNKVISLFAYLGILVLLPLFAGKDSKFARFHSNQGLILLIAGIAWAIVYQIVSVIFAAILLPGGWRVYSIILMILGILSLVFAVFVIIGIVNAVTGKAKELPVIGKFNLLK